MTTVVEIPLTPEPQGFSITLAGSGYQLRVQWREALAQCWIMDIADADGAMLVAGMPLLPGANLLKQYAYLNIGGELWLVNVNSDDPPAFSALGAGSRLYFITPVGFVPTVLPLLPAVVIPGTTTPDNPTFNPYLTDDQGVVITDDQGNPVRVS